MNTITVQLDDKKIEVRKLPIGEYPDLIKAIKRLPKHLQSFENLETDKILELLPEIVGDSLPDLLGVIALAVKLPVEEVETLGLAEIAKLIEAIFEVNNYAEVYKIIKKAVAHPALKKLKQTSTKAS